LQYCAKIVLRIPVTMLQYCAKIVLILPILPNPTTLIVSFFCSRQAEPPRKTKPTLPDKAPGNTSFPYDKILAQPSYKQTQTVPHIFVFIIKETINYN